MRKKSTYIILILILLIFLVVMFLIFGKDSFIKSRYQTTLVVGDDTAWQYKKKRWRQVDSTKYEELNWQKYNVFENNKRIGNYYLWHDDRWYVFNAKKDAVMLNGELFAYQANHDIKIKKFTKEEIDKDEYIEKVLEDNEFSKDEEFTTSYKVNLDFDSDGEEESFYVISNVFLLNSNPDRVFSIVFMVKNDKVYYLYNDSRPYRVYAGCKPDIITFLDNDNDDFSEVVLSCFEYSDLGRVDMLYSFVNNEFKMLISNQ